MPALQPYENNGPVDCAVAPDLSQLKDKSVIITGGASGIGEQITRSLAAQGAFVTIGDINETAGAALAAELQPNAHFVKCDATDWDSQLNLFKEGIAKSPRKSCDIVIANAGVRDINGGVAVLEDPAGEPTKPNTTTVDINLVGPLYSFKLATHYFRAQPDDEEHDRCFIVTDSLSAYVDFPNDWEYVSTKHAIRGFMQSVRQVSWKQGVRINIIAPSFVETPIISEAGKAYFAAKGIEWALAEDCAAAILKIACDRKMNGRSLHIVPRSDAKEGFLDGSYDDQEGAPEHIQKLQRIATGGFQGFLWN